VTPPVGDPLALAAGRNTAPAAAAAIGPQAATARIAELQQLMAEAGCGPAPSNGGASFAAALASAGQPTASAAGAFGTTGALGTAGAFGATGAGSNVAPADGSGSAPYDDLVVAAAQRNGIDPALLHGLIQQESGFDPSATSGAGAQGLCQLMPGTAASLGVNDPLDPAQSIDGGARYLKQQLDAFGGDPQLALAAYNAGPGAVRRYGGVPPYAETQAYVQQVVTYADAYRSSHPAMGAAAPPTPTPVFS
jgi:soluble lytic murein transglycosylase-like protein